MSDWQPIETAPRGEALKNGPSFLAYQDGMMAVGHFVRWREGDADSFYVDHVGGYEYEQDIERPSHWMPLPKPPAAD